MIDNLDMQKTCLILQDKLENTKPKKKRVRSILNVSTVGYSSEVSINHTADQTVDRQELSLGNSSTFIHLINIVKHTSIIYFKKETVGVSKC